MEEKQFKIPILFVVFNRPETTRPVFEEIRKRRPAFLYIAADGPRPGRPDDTERCREVRKIVADVDWPCEVKTLFSEKNLGCKVAESSAFNWFFKNVEMGICLEDDILPDQSFFPYCEELLERYKDDERVMHISGDNFQQNNPQFSCKESYYFSQIPHVWGFASWRRAWNLYDVQIKRWPEIKKSCALVSAFPDPGVYEYWSYVFDRYYDGRINSYDGQWVFACALHGGVCINPKVNLVSNLGFGKGSTHTKDDTLWFANLPKTAMPFLLIHPKNISINRTADAWTYRELFGINKKIYHRILQPIKTRFPKIHSRAKKLFGKK